jgi:hypothetical protein
VFNAYKIKYLVVGAHAFGFYAVPRFTKDLDVWVPPALNDAMQVYEALKVFGAPLRDLTVKDFANPSTMLQIGVAPVRIDIMCAVPGVSWEQAWKHRRKGRYGKAPIHVLGLAELIRAKKATGRPQDQLDLERLLMRKKPRT